MILVPVACGREPQDRLARACYAPISDGIGILGGSKHSAGASPFAQASFAFRGAYRTLSNRYVRLIKYPPTIRAKPIGNSKSLSRSWESVYTYPPPLLDASATPGGRFLQRSRAIVALRIRRQGKVSLFATWSGFRPQPNGPRPCLHVTTERTDPRAPSARSHGSRMRTRNPSCSTPPHSRAAFRANGHPIGVVV